MWGGDNSSSAKPCGGQMIIPETARRALLGSLDVVAGVLGPCQLPRRSKMKHGDRDNRGSRVKTPKIHLFKCAFRMMTWIHGEERGGLSMNTYLSRNTKDLFLNGTSTNDGFCIFDPVALDPSKHPCSRLMPRAQVGQVLFCVSLEKIAFLLVKGSHAS